jgi:hypothetical protein
VGESTDDDAREYARGKKHTTLAQPEALANAQNLATVNLAQGMVRIAMKGVRPPSEAINAKGQWRRDARDRHETLAASLTAVP